MLKAKNSGFGVDMSHWLSLFISSWYRLGSLNTLSKLKKADTAIASLLGFE